MDRLNLGEKCLVIGEVGQAHDGSLGTAHAFIDAIAKSGAHAVKFQTHIADAESTIHEKWRVKFSYQDDSRYDYWKRMEFSESQWLELKEHAEARDLLFISSPFSVEAVELLKRVGVAAWKIASGEVNYPAMFDRIADTGLPVLLSTGMSYWSEIDAAVGRIKDAGLDFAVMQCTSAYPCPPESIGLNLIDEFKKRYGGHAGLSDHSGTIYPGLAGIASGMDVLEVHVTLSKDAFGPDVPASLTPSELKQLVEGIQFMEQMKAYPVDKDEAARQLAPLRTLFTKSVVLATPLSAGDVLTEECLTGKKPGTGIPIQQMPELLGRKVKESLPANHILLEGDLEN